MFLNMDTHLLNLPLGASLSKGGLWSTIWQHRGKESKEIAHRRQAYDKQQSKHYIKRLTTSKDEEFL